MLRNKKKNQKKRKRKYHNSYLASNLETNQLTVAYIFFIDNAAKVLPCEMIHSKDRPQNVTRKIIDKKVSLN